MKIRDTLLSQTSFMLERRRWNISTAFVLSLVLIINMFAESHAATGLKLDGQVRWRTELDDRNVSPSERFRDFSYLRTRLALEASILTNTIIYLQIQDSRLVGGSNLFGEPVSGTQTDGKNVDVHQAYFILKHLWQNGPGLKAGRFEINRGNQRVLGAGDWGNVGRSWEGVLLWYAMQSWQLEWMWLKRLELDQTYVRSNDDFDVLITYFTLKKIQLDLFLLYEHDARFASGGPSAGSENVLDRTSLGLYFLRELNRTGIEANAVWQAGEAGFSADYPAKIAAWMFTLELAQRFAGASKPRIAFGADVTSADGDEDINYYDNLYYTGHKFRGYMDYFVSTSTKGLVDLYLRMGLEPSSATKLALDIHKFNSINYFTSFPQRKQYGYELDATVSTTGIEGATITGGASVFLPRWEEFLGSREARFWLYVMISASFSVSGEI